MDDDIQLPPLPVEERFGDTYGSASMSDYGRDCYEAGLADRERRAKVDAKPMKIHSRTLRFTNDGTIYREHENVTAVAVITLHWTNDGRVWIDSEKNRELARKLRIVAEVVCTAPNIARLRDAADALDGGM